MRPSFLDEMSWQMAEVYGAVTDRIMINLARHFKYVQKSGQITGSFEYQARMLAEMGQVTQETTRIIAASLEGADEALRKSLEAAIMDALKTEDPKLRKAAEKGLLRGGSVPDVSPNQMNAFRVYYQQSADKLNLVNTVMLESTQQAYMATVADAAARIQRTQNILNAGAGEVVTGVSSWNQAMHDAVRKMVDNGLTGFVDHGGHRWSPEAYVAMDIRTTMFNTARAAIWERADEFGSDLYQVSSHNGARPLCYPWQGKVISRTDDSREVEDLDGNTVHVYAQSETSYGEAAGLFGINCKHYPMTFIPGLSTLRGEPQSEEENEKAYQESQYQRALERKLREEKRDLEVMKAQGADDEQIKAQRQKVKDASAEIDDFCDKTGRARRWNRESAPVRATWPTGNGDVTRFNGGYIDANAKPPVKDFRVVTPKGQTEFVPAPIPKATDDFVLKTIPAWNIPPKDLTQWGKMPTTEEIVSSLGGADKTSGSCSSLAFAYAGNRGGYKVRDFRGGQSCSFFAKRGNIEKIAKLNGVDGIIVKNTNDFTSAHEILKNVQAGKEYYFGCASHAAIVRKSQKGIEYLELQSADHNGFHELTDMILRYRFGAKKTHSFYGQKIELTTQLMEVDKLKDNPDFLEALRYINTDENAQQKGKGGGMK